jgi:hypothetical protein
LVASFFLLGCGDDDRSGPPRDSGMSMLDGGGSDGGDPGVDGGGGSDSGSDPDAGGDVDAGGDPDGGGGPDAGRPPVDCVAGGGDAFDMTLCRLSDIACAYSVDCPDTGLPADPDMCHDFVAATFGSFRDSAPDLAQCRECLDAIATAFMEFDAMGVCPPPDEPPADVALKCDLDPTVDSDGDGIPNNDVEACGEPGESGGGGMGGDPGDPPPPPRP